MFTRLFKQRAAPTPAARRADQAAAGRWENEGGAQAHPSSLDAVAAVQAQVATPLRVFDAPGARQDELMSTISSDHRPPLARLRRLEWRLLGVFAALGIVAWVVWVSIVGISVGAVVGGLAVGVLLLVGASPVLGAGLLRGQEERAARKSVRRERQARRTR
jgi:hypothetical protein